MVSWRGSGRGRCVTSEEVRLDRPASETSTEGVGGKRQSQGSMPPMSALRARRTARLRRGAVVAHGKRALIELPCAPYAFCSRSSHSSPLRVL